MLSTPDLNATHYADEMPQQIAMEKISVSAFLLLVALSYTLAKDTTVKPGAKKDPKDSRPKLPQTLSRGWGDQLIWTQTYEEALYKSKTSNRPLMIIHHLDECPHSQDPSLTVRADITGRYSNRLYAYEPSDTALCKCCLQLGRRSLLL
ncbi:anterior gradient 2 [Cricetulus griseus]